MKKIFSIVLCLVMLASLLTLASCGKKEYKIAVVTDVGTLMDKGFNLSLIHICAFELHLGRILSEKIFAFDIAITIIPEDHIGCSNSKHIALEFKSV